jgi:hypothetical protein
MEMSLKQKIYNKHILLYNHDKEVFNYFYLAAKLPETMFAVKDMLELSSKLSDFLNGIDSCSTLPKLQSLRRRNLNILSALREDIRAMSFTDGPVIRRMWICTCAQRIEKDSLWLNRKIKDKIVWCIKTLREQHEARKH